LTPSPLIAAEADNDRVATATATATCADERAPTGETIANTSINTTNSRKRATTDQPEPRTCP